MTEPKPKWASVTVNLQYPVTRDDGTVIEKITMREPNGLALEEIDEIGVEQGKNPGVRETLAIIRALAGIEKDVTDGLHRRDVLALGEAIAPLLLGEKAVSPQSLNGGETTATE